jgi:hypothetical protein
MFILFIPAIMSIPSTWNDKAANFEKLDVNFSFQLKEPFYLLNDPKIKIDNNGTNLSDESLLITQDGVFYKRFLFFGSKVGIPLSKNVDISQSSNFDSTLNILLWFLIPSLFVWSIIFFVVYYAIIIIITSVLALIISWAFRLAISWFNLLKVSVYACTIMILIQLVFMPFYTLFLIPLLAYWLLVVIIMFLVKDELMPHGGSSVKLSNFKKDIFSSRKNDSDDVDEDIVRPKKRKRSYEEENDGYIELK